MRESAGSSGRGLGHTGPLGHIRRYGGDVTLGALIVGVVVLMIVPLQPWALDLLIALNIALSALVMSLSLFVRNPLAFSAFPTLLLTTTLYRLALNISSTRLILLKADAGRIIAGFGGFVVGGDILIGAVIFGILALVLFLVITKGAERVAEVAARFTLDALPGMQMAIDADLRSKALSTNEAKRRRAELERQSRYYGALDGAMKFVRGDAIVGVLIIGVNIVGGVAVGMLRHSMGALEALNLYGKLTIGDGLVTMIPALLVSTAAGLLVTRVGQGDSGVRLGRQLARQLWAEPWAIGTAGFLCFLLAMLPGLPAAPFLLFALSMGAAAAYQVYRTRHALHDDRVEAEADREEKGRWPGVSLQLGGELHDVLRAQGSRSYRQDWSRRFAELLRSELGLPVERVSLERGEDTAESFSMRLKNHGAVAGQLNLDPGVALTADELEQSAVHLFRECAEWLVGLDDVQRALDELAQSQPALVRETVPMRIALPELTGLCATLASDGIGLDYLPQILDGIARVAGSLPEDELEPAVRRRLSPAFTQQALNGDESVVALSFDTSTESLLLEALVSTSEGPRLVLDPELKAELIELLQKEMGNSNGNSRSVLLVRTSLREQLSRILRRPCPGAMVLAHGELASEVPVRTRSPLSLI